MATTPAFIGTGRAASVNVSAANTATDGSGSITTLISGAAGGTRILEVTAKCAATSAAAVVNIFLSVDSGTTWRIFDSIAISAITQSTTTAGFKSSILYDTLLLADTTHRLGVTTTIAQSTNVFALGGDL
jgi:hypothetical protein